jgi:hypothetical protein
MNRRGDWFIDVTNKYFTNAILAKVVILSTFVMVFKTYNIQLPKNLMYLGLHPPNTWKIRSMWKFSFCEQLSSPHWPMSEAKFYSQVQILHTCVVSSLWAKLIKIIKNWLISKYYYWGQHLSFTLELVSK